MYRKKIKLFSENRDISGAAYDLFADKAESRSNTLCTAMPDKKVCEKNTASPS